MKNLGKIDARIFLLDTSQLVWYNVSIVKIWT
jgi:hypothetical protein